VVPTFDRFFRDATGRQAHGYQVRLAQDGLPDVLEAPTGSGKTGVILAWLWRYLHASDRRAVPRRLVYALPQRSLVEQVAAEVTRWLEGLSLSDQIALHVVMGGTGESQRQWRLDMHRPAIVVGTVDSLVSKALNRGYGISRATYPIDFALVTNGAHWVIDEIQLCPESTTTLRQVAGFARAFGTAEPFGLTCMSATVAQRLLDTVDNPGPAARVVRIEPSDRVGELKTRLDAARVVRRLPVEPGEHKTIAAAVLERHRPGTLTLVVVNRVEVARAIHGALGRASSTPTMLLHSRFRGNDRSRLTERLTQVNSSPGPEGCVVVATQVVEAGVDINAATMITEAAPWPSLVQRAGRCNRTGRVEDAGLWWIPPAKPLPYPEADVAATQAALQVLEGEAVTGEGLLAQQVPTTEAEVSVVRRTDLLALFDTAPDLDGADLDIAPYVRDAEDLDVQVAWATWEPVDKLGRPADDVRPPEPVWRCRVPLGGVAALLKREVPVWRFDQVAGRWDRVGRQHPARPGEVLLVAAADGGYSPESGFDAGITQPVADAPALTPNSRAPEAGVGVEDPFSADSTSVAQPSWLSLQTHSEQARAHATALVAAVGTDSQLPADAQKAVVTAAYVHDVGKCHPTWQDALCRLAPPEQAATIADGRPWAKSDGRGRLTFPGTRQFRHELASLLLLDGPLIGLLDGAACVDLIRYLVLAHHGKLRVQIREPGAPDPDALLGLVHGATGEIPPLLGQPATRLTVDLAVTRLGGDRSWTRTALALRDRYGPFVLAYLETLVRIADWRASAGLPEAAQARPDDPRREPVSPPAPRAPLAGAAAPAGETLS
jgi:CRISPR-associated endonuclease/helicase Cas3